MFKQYGKNILDTKTKVWYYCKTISQAKRKCRELNELCKGDEQNG